MACQKQNGSWWRLFQGLEKRIGGMAVHILGTVDDDHPPAPFRRRQGEEARDLADVGSDDLCAQALAAIVELALHGEEVRVPARGDTLEQGVGGVGPKPLSGIRILAEQTVLRGVLPAPGEKPAGEPVGQCRLADALGAGQQPGVMHAPGPRCLHQDVFRPGVALELGIRARINAGHG